MSVEILAIKFNHNPFSATTCALNVRRNATQFVTVPEWQRGISINAEDSVAAYAISKTMGNTLTIQAKFACADLQKSTFEVRAVHPPLPIPWNLPPYYLNYYNLWQLLLRTQVNILGEVKAKKITFQPNGESNFEVFELQGHRLLNRGVGIHRVMWCWQFRSEPYGQWTDFATTKHKIYTVRQTPTKPWRQTPYDEANIQLPWTDVLDYACHWASRAYTLDEAATSVTRNVYNLGKGLLEYGCPIGGISVYSFPYFNCTAFLERLRGGIGRGRYVNCSDCATIVSTFANILGCDLWQSLMSTWGKPFPVNPILVIGSSKWQFPCTPKPFPGLGFSYHEVAWKGNCTSDDEVFDACLSVDNYGDPTRVPHWPLLPTNMRFGRLGERQYRYRLAMPWGRDLCEPQPTIRQRRIIF